MLKGFSSNIAYFAIFPFLLSVLNFLYNVEATILYPTVHCAGYIAETQLVLNSRHFQARFNQIAICE